MWPFLSISALGFVLGMRHATDPDHVVAVATVVSREKTLRAAAPIGMLWGLGHTLTVMIVGVAIIVFGLVIPPRIGLGMEFCVAMMLVFLGAWNLWMMNSSAEHDQSSSRHHDHPGVERTKDSSRAFRTIRPLAIGIVHGLAGSAAIALLVIGSIHNSAWSVAYLFLFGIGTVAGMMLITTAMAAPVVFSAAKLKRVHSGLVVGSSALSLLFGAFLIYQIGVVHGLFSAAPVWVPQ